MEMNLVIGINLNNLTIQQYQWIMNGLAELLAIEDFESEEQEKMRQFFDELIDIEKRLILAGEM